MQGAIFFPKTLKHCDLNKNIYMKEPVTNWLSMTNTSIFNCQTYPLKTTTL